MRIDVLGVGFDNLTMVEAVEKGMELVRSQGADYVVITDGVPAFHHVDYPTAHLRERIKNSNFPEEIKVPALVYAGSHID